MCVRDEFDKSPTVKSEHDNAINSRYDGLWYLFNLKIAFTRRLFVKIVVTDVSELLIIKTNLRICVKPYPDFGKESHTLFQKDC